MKNSFTLLIALLLVSVYGVSPSYGQKTIVVQSPSSVQTVQTVQTVGTYTVNGGTFSMPMSNYGWFGGGGNGLHLLNDPSVMKDLELVGDQRERLAEVNKEFGKQLKEVMKEFGKAKDDHERIKQLQEEMQAIQRGQADARSSVLLPHQLDRIKQVSNQMQMNSMGSAGALQYGMLAKELEISDEQKKKLLEIQQKLQKEIAEKTKQLKEDAKKQVMAELTADQRAKLKEMTGEEFKREPDDWKLRLNKSPRPIKSK